MQKITKVTMITLFCLSLTVFSCRENEKIVPEKAKKSSDGINQVEIVDGMYKFKSQEHYLNTISEIKTKKIDIEKHFQQKVKSLFKLRVEITENKLVEIAKSGNLGSFKSVIRIESSTDGNNLAPLVSDPILEKLLNSKNMMSIGDEIFIVSGDNTYITAFSNENLSKIKNGQSIETFNDVRTHKVQRKNENFELVDKRNNSARGTTVGYTHLSRQYQFEGSKESVNYLPFYAYARVFVKHKKFVYGAFGTSWWAWNNTPFLSFTFTGSVFSNYSNFAVSGGDSASNEADVWENADYVSGTGVLAPLWNTLSGTAVCTGVNGANYIFTFN